MKKLLKFIGIAFLALIVLGAVGSMLGGETESEKKNNTEAQSSKKEKKEKKEKSSEEVGVGETLRVGDVEFTIKSFETVNKIGSGFTEQTPETEGAVFLVIDTTVKNVGKEAINTDSSFFSVLTSDDITYSASTIVNDGYFLFESINPGLEQSGKVAFEIPQGLTDLQVQVQTGFWGTETGIINLK